MSKFVPFNGRGLCHYNHVDKGYLCTFCSKSFGSFNLYEEHWPKCTGVCAERPFKPFEQPVYPKFPSSFVTPKPAGSKPADSKPAEPKPAAAPKETKAGGDAQANAKNSNKKKENKKG
ncbi:hypothetical protein GGH91_005130 [Coemansia sp. RSA 2671]|uniref:Uncharacterized protein n=2 Tax=Coemansia TaxID=4863 RepID=A0A9W8L600_9FUNG|nr:hypothetical protein LPJ60_006588 [Coemansia sp. RSA 2675]KAJ2021631.1 hypothetical protein IWW57_004852 [Coemansia sp. S610]KAJ2337165.1 hypothetical protein GGH91_005130 [Coemansia sp. RSA 2671]KAJ2412612.1 hypothetical protein GGI10_003581 [Coemansia sp. RSA 2530]KAJ2689261.1 hypothetical protein IWW39_001608 [Coemansia spiralis]KAJ2698664.1 hypothetical protein H4218_003137 [Coemansia sp. IMI 209128]KAJ2792837.1 hypothetical protein GGI18_000081 [Coemansia linderi]